MLVKEISIDKLIPLKTSDSGLTALAWMEEFKVSHWPVVNEEDFLALVCDTDIYNLNNPEEALGNHQLSLLRPYVSIHQSIFDLIKIVDEQNLSLIPVLDEHHRYLGVITLRTLLIHTSRLLGVKEPGAVIILELNQNDYFLSQIVQIVESSDSRILSLNVFIIPESTRLNVIIKINRVELGPVLQTFTRFNYTIKAYFTDESMSDDLLDRYDEFMNFLNI